MSEPQLQMLLSERGRASVPVPVVPAGYRLRQYRPADEESYLHVMVAAGFVDWTREQVRRTLPTVLSDGFFVVEAELTGQVVATAMAQTNAIDGLPSSAELGWVACDPAHRGRGLGMAVCAAATGRLVRGGFRHVYLKTDDFRLPSIRIYLRLGYEPWLFVSEMQQRWRALEPALAGCGLKLPE